MNKMSALRVVNAALLFSFILQAATSIIIFMKMKVPHRELVFETHEYNGLFMIILAATHIALNWGWIKANFLKSGAKRTP